MSYFTFGKSSLLESESGCRVVKTPRPSQSVGLKASEAFLLRADEVIATRARCWCGAWVRFWHIASIRGNAVLRSLRSEADIEGATRTESEFMRTRPRRGRCRRLRQALDFLRPSKVHR